MRLSLFFILALLSFVTKVSCQVELQYFHDNIWRDYIFYTPSGIQPDAPLLFVLHGYSDQALWAMEYTEMNNLADQEGFAVCYPSGTLDEWGERFWNVGYDFQSEVLIDDIGFLVALAELLQTEYNLDANRTFCTGFSNGGDMCFKVACEAYETFKAVAPVAGAMMDVVYETCDPNNPIPIFITNGTADPITLWDGDMANVDGWGAYHDVSFGMEFFSDANFCTDVIIDTVPNYVVWDGSFVVREKRSNGINGNQVWLYKIVGDGHTWPGFDGNQDIHLSVDIWDFFSLYDSSVATSDLEQDLSSESSFLSIDTRFAVPTEFQIYDLEGRILINGFLNAETPRMKMEFLPIGLYFLKVEQQILKVLKNY